MQKRKFRRFTIKVDGEKLYDLFNAVAEKSYLLGYSDAQAKKPCNKDQVKVSEQSVRTIK